MKLTKLIGLPLIALILVPIMGCGPLLERPPDNTPPTEIELFGEENTITVIIDGRPLVFKVNGKFTHLTIEGTDKIPAHSILAFGGRAGESDIDIKVYQDGGYVTNGGYDGASSIFSLDGSVIIDFALDGERYYSQEYGPGAGGTTIYYNSFVSIKDIKLQSYNQPLGEKAVKALKGTFKGILKPYTDPIAGKQIIISGKINFKATE